jgi:hypothetical protein
MINSDMRNENALKNHDCRDSFFFADKVPSSRQDGRNSSGYAEKKLWTACELIKKENGFFVESERETELREQNPFFGKNRMAGNTH